MIYLLIKLAISSISRVNEQVFKLLALYIWSAMGLNACHLDS